MSKTYGATAALSHAQLNVERGEVHGLIGSNGSGKSTMIKILAGSVAADPGATIDTFGASNSLDAWNAASARRAGLRFVHQDPGLFASMTVSENLWGHTVMARRDLGRIHWRALHQASRVALARVELDVDPASSLGSLRAVEQTMVAIARALADIPTDRGDSRRILVMDEPTACLPDAEVGVLLALARRLAASGHSVIHVSHRLTEIVEVCDRVTVLRDGRNVEARPMSGLNESDLVQLVTGERITTTRESVKGSDGAELLTIADLRSRRLNGVSLTVRRGEIVGVAGLLGSGRTELLRALFGDSPRTGGRVHLAGAVYAPATPKAAVRASVMYVPQDRRTDAAFADLSVGDNLSAAVVSDYWSRWRLCDRRKNRDATDLLTRYQIKAASVSAPMRTLSGGNQQKVVLGRWLRRSPVLLLLDEPSQGVDVGARAEIHRIIREVVSHGAGALVVSSDLQELCSISDRVLVLRDGRILNEINGADIEPSAVEHSLHLPRVAVS